MGGGVARAGEMLAVLSLIGISLSACTVANVQAPVKGLAQATSTAKSMLDKEQAEIDRNLLEAAYTKATQSGARISWQGCALGAERCQLYVTNGTAEPWPLNRGAISHAVIQLMAGIDLYAKNLESLASAETMGQIATAMGQIKSGIGTLAGNIDDLNKAGGRSSNLKATITPYSGPILDLVSFGLQKYVERQKVKALTQAVDEMQPILDEAVIAFELVAMQASDFRQAGINKRFFEAAASVSNARQDRSKIAALSAAADTYDEFLQIKATGVFANLALAHQKLGDALHARNLSFDELWPYLQSIFDETAKFAALLKQLEDAGKKP